MCTCVGGQRGRVANHSSRCAFAETRDDAAVAAVSTSACIQIIRVIFYQNRPEIGKRYRRIYPARYSECIGRIEAGRIRYGYIVVDAVEVYSATRYAGSCG